MIRRKKKRLKEIFSKFTMKMKKRDLKKGIQKNTKMCIKCLKKWLVLFRKT